MMDSFASLFGIFFGFIWILWFFWMAIMIGAFVFWIVMLIDVVQRKFPKENDKIIWILVVVLAGIIGALIYYFMVKRKDRKTKKG